MVESRRNSLNGLQPKKCTNASLWLDKYMDRSVSDQSAQLPGQSQEKKIQPPQVLVDQVLTIEEPTDYAAFYKRWQDALKNVGAQTKVAQTQNRLAVSLGADSVLETSIALHHTYGVPFIPGSALKGLTAHFADQNLEGDQWKKGGEAHTILFGDQDNAGYLTFFDALYIPGSGKDRQALWKDVMTVHHPKYYQDGSDPPADWDGTRIIPFLTATGDFLIALAEPDADPVEDAGDWVKKTFEIIELALEHEGIGAKTSSGYGRMSFVEKGDGPEGQAHDSDKQVDDSEQQPVENYEILKRELLAEAPPTGRYRGTIKNVKPDGRYAFINPARGGADDFVHKNQMLNKKPLREGQVVEYSIGLYQDRPQAQNVEVLLER